MNIIFAECGSERHQAIIKAMSEGGDAYKVGEQFGVTKETVQKIVRTYKKLQPFEIVLTDGISNVPIAEVRTSQGFMHACKSAVKRYSGTFSNLELPSWKLVSGGASVSLADLRNELVA